MAHELLYKPDNRDVRRLVGTPARYKPCPIDSCICLVACTTLPGVPCLGCSWAHTERVHDPAQGSSVSQARAALPERLQDPADRVRLATVSSLCSTSQAHAEVRKPSFASLCSLCAAHSLSARREASLC